MSRRAEHLFSIIGQVDDAFIDEAACPRRLPRPQHQWTKWAALCAACLLLAVGLWRIVPLWPAADGNANGAAPPSNEGSSGGALLNVYGQVVAVTSGAYVYGNSMYLAVPIDPILTADLTGEGLTLPEVLEPETVG